MPRLTRYGVTVRVRDKAIQSMLLGRIIDEQYSEHRCLDAEDAIHLALTAMILRTPLTNVSIRDGEAWLRAANHITFECISVRELSAAE